MKQAWVSTAFHGTVGQKKPDAGGQRRAIHLRARVCEMGNHRPRMDLADPTFDDVLAARRRLQGRVHCTPVFHSDTFDRLCGAQVHFKCENLQRAGAFKARGAMNAVQSLSDADSALGVITHSSGNHGAALALAARERGIPADVVVPKGTARVKVDASMQKTKKSVAKRFKLTATGKLSCAVRPAFGTSLASKSTKQKRRASAKTKVLSRHGILRRSSVVSPFGL